MKQGVGSTTSWKPRLSNYKSHVKKKRLTCRIVRHFIENCNDNGFNNLRFTIVDSLNNVEGLTDDETFFFSSSQKREVLEKYIGHATSWFKYQA